MGPGSRHGDVAFDADGVAASSTRPIRQIRSPNHDARPDDAPPTLVVVHAISLPPGCFGGRAIDALFTNTLDPAAQPCYAGLVDLRVSAHFLIRRDGEVVQFVPCSQRAWHAGVSSFKGRARCNDFSIGIELEGDDESAFEGCQYERLDALVAGARDRYPLDAIVGHSEIAPGRKTDPGPHFDWSRVSAGSAAGLRRSAPR